MRQAKLRERKQKQSENAKRSAALTAIVKQFKKKHKNSRQIQKLVQQAVHQNRQLRAREWCTRHMCVEQDYHDVILEYVQELTKGRLNRSREWSEGFDTERWYDLKASETKVRNYYVFEYMTTHVCAFSNT